MKVIFEEIWQLALPFLDTRMNVLHTRIAMTFAFKLLEKEGGDEDIVIPAVILHDVGWKEIPEHLHLNLFGPHMVSPGSYREHELASVKIAKSILEQANYDGDRVEEIIEIIDGHDSRTDATSTNDSIVKDADKLWRYSHEGFQTDIKRFGETVSERLDDLRTHIDRWFFTPSARQLATQQLAARILDAGIPPGA